MNDLNQILKNLDWNHRRPFGWGSSPDADWRVIFVATVVLVITVCVLNFFMYLLVDRGDFFGGETPQGVEELKLDINKLRDTVSYYEGKQAEFEKIKKGETTQVSDPSL